MSKISDVSLSIELLTMHMQKALLQETIQPGTSEVSPALPSRETDGVSSTTDASLFVAREFVPLRMQPEFQPAADDAYHVNDLLRFHDREFVRNAYHAVLKRVPEASGFTDYLERLRQGRVNKVDVLGSLRYSPEGSQRGVRIEGLRLPFLLRRAGRLPVIGYFVRWAVAVMRLPILVHNHSQLSSYATAQFEHAAEHINNLALHFTAEMNRYGHHTAQQLNQLFEAQRRLQADFTVALTAHEARFARQDMRFDEQDVRLGEQEEQTAIHNARLERYGKQFEDVLGQLEILRQSVERIQTDAAAIAAQQDELQNLKQTLQRTLMEFNLQPARATQDARERSRGRPAASSPETESTHTSARYFTDAMYAAFEDRFRGTPDDIKERLSVYLPLVRQVPAGDLLDLGSGRGEWLELLRAEGRRARGVDTNRVFVADCHARGLNVVEGDALSYLRSLEADSLAMVSGLHIVEHLPLDALTELLTETARVLLPGGLALFETPNPENVLVGSLFFYIDPTHRNPLPSLTLRFLLESRGFDRVEVLNLHPYESARLSPVNEKDHITVRFNELFYGAMDYGISGWKPAR